MSKHHHHDAPKDNYYLPVATWEKGRNVLLALFVISWVAALAGFSLDHKQFFPSYLVAFFFGAGIIIGSALFIMMQHLTGSAWSVPLRRLMENIMMTMPILAKCGSIGHHIAEPTTRPMASSATTPCPSRISISQSSGRCDHCTPIDSA